MRLVRPLLILLLALLTLGATLIPTADAAPGAPPAAPTATPRPRKPLNPVRITIGSIKLDQKIISVGLDKKHVPIVPKHDIGWYNLSARPGEGENIVLWGHVLRFRSAPKRPAPFARLREAKVGDAVVLYDSKGNAYRYTITEQVWVTPDQVEYILPVGTERITMVSCIGDKVIANGGVVEMTHRLITIAEPAE
jgi:LPXTG-site transpeptidase (sortase) family protein